MRLFWPLLAIAVCLQADPKIISIHPFTGQPGTTFLVTIRGSNLGGAIGAHAGDAPFSAAVERVETEAPGKVTINLVTLRVQAQAGAKPGRYPIRLITRGGISNALPIHLVALAVTPEPDGSHELPDAAIRISAMPGIFSGRLARRGEADYYAFQAEAGQTITFDAISGLPQIASGGSAATIANFDPSLSIYESGGSWFDPKRLNRVAYNDEPVWVFGQPTDAHLVHRFAKSGDYLLRVEAFAGQGGPDYGYQLKIAPGEVPHDIAPTSTTWRERAWTRRLDSNRLNQLAVRGGTAEDKKSIETYRAGAEAAPFKLPGTLEGALTKPGETHRARFHLDQPADIAIEVETPSAAPPFFNPIVRLLNHAGEEVATNIFAGLGACSGALTKSTQAKTILALRDTGDYTLEIRDATADLAGPEFQYRVQIRPQIPHIGEVKIETDHLNLAPGEAKTIRVGFDREENYRGAITVIAESLPPGVTAAAAGADFEPDTDPPLATGKRERYTPRSERAVVVLAASADAAPSAQPQQIRLVVRPLVDGKLGGILSTKSLYVMVIEKQ